MRLRHPSGRVVHLGYEARPRPVRRTPALAAQLDVYAAARTRLGADSLGVSLHLPPALAAALASGGRARTRLRAELDARRLEVVMLSGSSLDEEAGSPFVEGGGEPATTPPGWADPAHLEYTLDLARILVDLLPEDTVRGAVGTVGLGRRDRWDAAAEQASLGVLRRLSAGLADIAWQNGRAVRVGFQTAPGYVMDSPDDIVAALTGTDKERLAVRLDLDHALSAWPDPVGGIVRITDAGLAITEVRLSAAPGADTADRRAALAQLLLTEGTQTEFLTVATYLPDPSAKQIAADVAYVLEELDFLGLALENERCSA